MTRTKKFHTRIASLALAAVSALTFVACVDSGDKPGSIAPVAQTGDCANIQDLLDKAIGDAAEANDAADESRGTPDGPSDANKAEAAEALVDELIEQKEECKRCFDYLDQYFDDDFGSNTQLQSDYRNRTARSTVALGGRTRRIRGPHQRGCNGPAYAGPLQ